MQLIQGLWSALIQGHQSTQHGVETKVHIWSQQVVQQGVDPFGVCSAADQVADFGSQAGGGGGCPLDVVIATCAEGQHTLEGLVGPQQTALVNSQGTGVVQDNSSILQRHIETNQVDKTQLY